MSERKGRKYAAMALALILLFQGCLSDGLPVCALEHAEGADAGEEKTADSGCAEDTGAVSCVPEEPGETSEETEKETETEPEETPEPTEKIFPGWTLKSAVNDAGNTVRNEAGTYYFRGCLEVLFQSLRVRKRVRRVRCSFRETEQSSLCMRDILPIFCMTAVYMSIPWRRRTEVRTR